MVAYLSCLGDKKRSRRKGKEEKGAKTSKLRKLNCLMRMFGGTFQPALQKGGASFRLFSHSISNVLMSRVGCRK